MSIPPKSLLGVYQPYTLLTFMQMIISVFFLLCTHWIDMNNNLINSDLTRVNRTSGEHDRSAGTTSQAVLCDRQIFSSILDIPTIRSSRVGICEVVRRHSGNFQRVRETQCCEREQSRTLRSGDRRRSIRGRWNLHLHRRGIRRDHCVRWVDCDRWDTIILYSIILDIVFSIKKFFGFKDSLSR